MTARATIPSREEVGADTPLRLDVAAVVAFPDKTMTGRGLRLEANRGRLDISKVAGRYYTTLRAIGDMLRKCRHEASDLDCGSGTNDATPPAASRTPPCGSSSTEAINEARDAALTIVSELKEPSPPTSPENRQPRRKARVIPITSRLPA